MAVGRPSSRNCRHVRVAHAVLAEKSARSAQEPPGCQDVLGGLIGAIGGLDGRRMEAEDASIQVFVVSAGDTSLAHGCWMGQSLITVYQTYS